MRFFILIIVLALFLYRPWLLKYCQKDMFVFKWRNFLVERLPQHVSPYVFLAVYLLPAIVVSTVLLCFLEEKLFGILYLLLSLAFLAFSLGRSNIVKQYNDYAQEWKSGTARNALDELCSEEIKVENDKDIHLTARTGLIYNCFEQLLCVLFWFVVTGVVIPVIYRLLKLYMIDKVAKNSAYETISDMQEAEIKNESSTQLLAQRLINLIEFIPAVLVSVALNIVADVKFKGISALKANLTNLNIQQMLTSNVDAALGLQTTDDMQVINLSEGEQRTAFYQKVEKELGLLEISFKRLLTFFIAVATIWLILF